MEYVNKTQSLDFMNSTIVNCTSNETDVFSLLDLYLPYQIRILRAIIFVTELILGMFLNTALILLIILCKSLHQRGFATTILILFMNLGNAVPLLSTSAYSVVVAEWRLGDSFCRFIASNTQTFQIQRWLLTTVLVIDRALTINRPLRYERYGARIVLFLSTAALITGFLNGIVLYTALQSCIGFIPGISTCYIYSITSIRRCGRYLVCSSTGIILLGGVLPFILCMWMFFKATKARMLQVAPIANNNTDGRSTAMITSSATHHSVLSRKQMFTIFLFFWTLLGCALPYYFSYVILYLSLVADSPRGSKVGYYLLILTQPIYQGLVIADPIALMWHKDVKEELKKIKRKIKLYATNVFFKPHTATVTIARHHCQLSTKERGSDATSQP